MNSIENRRCDPFWKSIGSRIKKFLGYQPTSKFYVVYPPLDQAEEIREHLEVRSFSMAERGNDIFLVPRS